MFPHALRISVRSLSRQPAFCAVAILTLAIGIGANTAVFSAINGVLLQPLPYPAGDRLATLNTESDEQSATPSSVSYPDLADIRDKSGTFSDLVGVRSSNLTLTELGTPEIIAATLVTEGLLSTFGLAPVLGRDIRRDEFGDGGANVAVIANGFWRDRLGGAVDAVGKSLRLDGVSYEIVGVAPAGFDYPSGATIWIPNHQKLSECGRGCQNMEGIGRLATGVDFVGAQAKLATFGANLTAEYPATNTEIRFMVRDLKTRLLGDVRAGLWTTFGAALLVLLIACANVASLLLARASAQEGEMAVRAALGATRRRIAGQVFAEGAVLAAAGGIVGVMVAYAGVRLLRHFVGDSIPRAELIRIHPGVLLLAFVAILVVMLAFSAMPAFAASRAAIAGSLGSVGRGASTTAATLRFRRALLGGEVALSTCLLIGAGLLFRTLTQLQAVDVGFETRQITRFSVVLPEASYTSVEQSSQFYDALEGALAALPGVEGVGSMWSAPLSRGQATGVVLVTGRPEPTPGHEANASVHPVRPAALSTLGIALRRGRLLAPADDRPGAEPVAVVNETFARENFPGEDAIGQRVRMTVSFGYGSPEWRIVGVVGDAHFRSLTEAARADIYLPHALVGPLSLTVHVRTSAASPDLMRQVRSTIDRLDPDVAVFRVETLQQVLERATAATTLYLNLVAIFAVVAALLAAVGLYGVVSYMIVQRRREIGIRVALGARREGIVTLMVRRGMSPVVIGIAAGAGIALAAGRYVQSLLFNVQTNDPLAVTAAVVLMSVVALVASAVPAIRASGVAPAGVLHSD